MTMHCIAPGIRSRYTKEELKAIFKKLDLVIVDLDGCIFPGVTKVTMYRDVCISLFRMKGIRNYILLGYLLMHAAVISLMKFSGIFCSNVSDKKLILYFTKIVKKVPLSYLRKASVSIPGRSCPGARETLKILSEKAPVGIISQALDIVLDEYVRQFSGGGKNMIRFCDGNILSDLTLRNEKENNPFMFTGMDKEKHAKKRMLEFCSKKTMVIGHDRNDLLMMKAVREHNGITVGFNPIRKAKKLCDIIVTGKNWIPFQQVLQELI